MPALVGIVLIAAGLVCNQWVIGALLTPDGRISRTSDLIVLWVLQIAACVSGLAMIRWRHRPVVARLASSARIPLLIAWTALVLEASVRTVNSVYALELPAEFQSELSYEWLEGGDWFNGLTRLYDYTPHSVGVTYGHPFRANRWGFRGPDFEPRAHKPDGTFRLLVVGDSTTMGHAVAEEDRYSDVLGRELRRAYPETPIEVINLGVEGFETVQEVKILHRLWSAVDPDFVILGFSLNDPNVHYDGYRPHEIPLPFLLRAPLSQLESFRLSDRMYDILYRKTSRSPDPLEQMWQAYSPQSPDWQLFQASVDEIGTFVRHKLRPAPIVICLDEVNQLERRGVHNQVVETFRKAGFTWVEIPTGVFRPVSRFEGHPNEATHAHFAQALFAELQAEHVIEHSEAWQARSQR